MNHTYALVAAEKTPLAITEAVRAGAVELVTEPLSFFEMAAFFTELNWRNQLKAVQTSRFFGAAGAGDCRHPELEIPESARLALTPIRV